MVFHITDWCRRMILYFPVSALVTLFGNILQNPLDPRAKADTRLMNLVVTFLSMLGQEAEQGGVHRMLGVCAEFERIAKVVIEKAEKEQTSRRKRKTVDTPSSKDTPRYSDATRTNGPHATPAHRPSPAATPAFSQHGEPRPATSDHLSPPLTYSPMTRPGSDASPSMASTGWVGQDFAMGQGDFDAFAELEGVNGFSPNLHSPSAMMGGSYAQPVLPPDVFALPMSLDWNWAEMSGGAYPTVENGNFGDGMAPNQFQHQ